MPPLLIEALFVFAPLLTAHLSLLLYYTILIPPHLFEALLVFPPLLTADLALRPSPLDVAQYSVSPNSPVLIEVEVLRPHALSMTTPRASLTLRTRLSQAVAAFAVPAVQIVGRPAVQFVALKLRT